MILQLLFLLAETIIEIRKKPIFLKKTFLAVEIRRNPFFLEGKVILAGNGF